MKQVELANKIAYVMKSDGSLYVVDLTDCKKPETMLFHTGLTKDQDIEGMGMDLDGTHLLIVTKQDPKQSVKRAVYALSNWIGRA